MADRSELGRLREGQRLDPLDLTLAEATALAATRLVTVEPLAAGWRITAGHTVGAVRCGDLVVRVRPVLPPLQVLRLLARANGLPAALFDDHRARPPDDTPTWPLDEVALTLAVLFAREAGTALASGPVRGYRELRTALPVLRGRLDLRDRELRRFGRPVPLVVTVDELTTDTAANRRLRAAGRLLLALPGLPRSAADRLGRLDRQLADVPIEGDPPSWRPNAPDVRLHRLLHLADLVLVHRAAGQGTGGVEIRGCTFSMATLFRQLVTRLLTEAAAGLGFGVSSQRRHGLDARNRLTIRPDLLVTAGSRPVAVADARYEGRLADPDAHRLIAYCARLGLDTGHLLHASDGPRSELYDVLGAGTRLVVHRIDLRQPVDELARSVHTVFLKLVRLRPTSAIA